MKKIFCISILCILCNIFYSCSVNNKINKKLTNQINKEQRYQIEVYFEIKSNQYTKEDKKSLDSITLLIKKWL